MKTNLSISIITTTFVLLFFNCHSQTGGVAIGPTGAPPDPSAALDVQFSNKGTLITRLTTAQRDSITNPANGLLIFNNNTNCFNVWVGTSWKYLCPNCGFSDPFASNNGPVCLGNTLNLSASFIAGATYLWTGPHGFSSTQQNPSINNFTISDTGTYTLVATVNGCSSNPQSTVVLLQSTAGPLVSNSGPAYSGDTLNLTASLVSGATYSWSGPNGFTSTQQNPVISNFVAADSGTYTVITTANGCPSAPQITIVSFLWPKATGGTVSHQGGYFIHTFTNSDNFTPNSNINVDALVVAGGGGGGGGGNAEGSGGGGAGGVVYQTNYAVTGATVYAVTVGNGGAAGTGGANGASGDNSAFATLTANGGGAGAGGPGGHPSSSGGSGGGGGYGGNPGSAGTIGQGNAGGNYYSGAYRGGGGGGAGTAGADGSSNGTGGDGLQFSISGTLTYYGGGGGGGSYGQGFNPAGGLGGGGNGGNASGPGNGPGASGAAFTGGGGGGAGYLSSGGAGGSGIVIIRYQ